MNRETWVSTYDLAMECLNRPKAQGGDGTNLILSRETLEALGQIYDNLPEDAREGIFRACQVICSVGKIPPVDKSDPGPLPWEDPEDGPFKTYPENRETKWTNPHEETGQ